MWMLLGQGALLWVLLLDGLLADRNRGGMRAEIVTRRGSGWFNFVGVVLANERMRAGIDGGSCWLRRGGDWLWHELLLDDVLWIGTARGWGLGWGVASACDELPELRNGLQFIWGCIIDTFNGFSQGSRRLHNSISWCDRWDR